MLWNDDELSSDGFADLLPGETRNADPERPGVAGSAGIFEGTGTGQHGIAPVRSGDGNMGMAGAVHYITDTLHQPFAAPYSALDIFLIVGVIMAAVILWNLILFHIRIAAEAI